MGMVIRVSSLAEVPGAVDTMTREIVNIVTQEVDRRSFLAANELKAASDDVLQGERHGRMYGNHRASASGEAPAQWTGRLRGSMVPSASGGGGHWTAKLTAGAFYATYLENGTRKMAARPMKQPILDKAEPKIREIFSRPYH